MKTRLYTSDEAKYILQHLESKTKLTPNIICRYGIILSLKNNDPLTFDYNNSGQEFHRPILTGEYDLIFKELIKQKIGFYIDDDEYFGKYLKSHLERGIRLLKKEIDLCVDFDSFLNEFFNTQRGGLLI